MLYFHATLEGGKPMVGKTVSNHRIIGGGTSLLTMSKAVDHVSEHPIQDASVAQNASSHSRDSIYGEKLTALPFPLA